MNSLENSFPQEQITKIVWYLVFLVFSWTHLLIKKKYLGGDYHYRLTT